ncbi:MAG: F0F1 ATP synthase subunit A [Ruminococcaceae bacterium]|nr:F0F1 ATP synthase subunit A [Oscillospiraceae bacterium]
MNKANRRFAAVDVLLLVLTILPLAVGLVLKILFTPPSEGIQITGALVYFTIPFPVQDIIISEAQVNSWLVILSVLFLCLYLTHGIRAKVKTRRQAMLEWVVEKSENMVRENMGDYFMGFVPFIAAILALSAFSSLLSLLGMYPPTSDINIVGGWAILVFILITYYKFKCGPLGYLKSFGDPVPFLAPLNIISEVATPISMAFRHYGNILSGTVISVLIATGLQGLTAIVLGWLPGWLGEFPFLRIGLPAVLSIYFDVFSGVLQAYIFAMLTMLYVAGGFPAEEFFKRQEKKKAKS